MPNLKNLMRHFGQFSNTFKCKKLWIFAPKIIFKGISYLCCVHNQPMISFHLEIFEHLLVTVRACLFYEITNNHPRWCKNNPLPCIRRIQSSRPFDETASHWCSYEDHWHSQCCIWIAPKLTNPWEELWLTRFLSWQPSESWRSADSCTDLMPITIAEK